ncbi:hypothetical protein D3C84_143390 [compost metagenome]
MPRCVASQFTALAPFSQKFTTWLPGASPQAQPGQSKPPFWLVLSRVRMFFRALSLPSQARVTLRRAPQPPAGPA